MSKHHVNSRRMHKLRADFFEQGKRAKPGDGDCWLCGEPIDYAVTPGTTPESHNLDHATSVKDRPDLQEDPTNFRHSHMLCNSARGARTPSPGLGETVPNWW